MFFLKNTKKIITAIVSGFIICSFNFNNTIVRASYEERLITNIIVPPAIVGTYAPIDIEQKNTNSVVYIRLSRATYSVSTQIWGLNSMNWYGGKNCTCNANGDVVNSVILNPYINYTIQNDVKTYGYGFAGLKMCSTNQYNSYTVSLSWSPDYV